MLFSIPLLLFCFLVAPLYCAGQCASLKKEAASNSRAQVEKMMEAGEWERLVDHLSSLTHRNSDQEYVLGLALSRLDRLDRAEEVFRKGRERAPTDSRFPSGLAGVEFRRRHLSEAEDWLHEAREKGADADYIDEFLGTIYYLRENLQATLKYWNRLGRPEITTLRYEPVPSLDPFLVDRFFTFSQNELLTVNKLRSSQARLRAARVFSRLRFELVPLDEKTFELIFRSTPRIGLNHGKRAALFTLARELPFETVRFDIYNPQGKAKVWENSYRWDSTRRRFLSRFTRRLTRAPQWGYWLDFDLRSETWELNPEFTRLSGHSFGFEKVGGTAGFEYLGGHEWIVRSEFHLAGRQFDREDGDGGRFHDGALLRYRAEISRSLWSRPEEDLELKTRLRAGLGSVPGDDRGVFPSVEAGLEFHSYLDRSDHDWRVGADFRAGRIAESAPFDELFLLGIDQDSALWLRGHSVTRDGVKGNSPLGNQYFLANFGIMRPLWESGLLNLEIGPFLDLGWAEDTLDQMARGEWFADAGVQLNIRLLGDLVVQLSYGRDLRNGGDSFRVLPRSRLDP